MTCTASSSSTIAMKRRLRGWRSIHVTDGDHPYMKRWWVPGLQIGYEHTFIHQFADFLLALGEGKQRRADVPRWPGDRLCDRFHPPVRQDRAMGEGFHRVHPRITSHRRFVGQVANSCRPAPRLTASTVKLFLRETLAARA